MSTVVPGGWPPSPANDPGLRKVIPASFMVYNDPYDQKYHAVSDGSLGVPGQDFVSASPSSVITSAFNNLTAGRTWKQKVVVNGSIPLDAKLTIPAYTELDMTNATVKLNNSVNDIMYLVNGSNIHVHGGIHDKNGANNTTNSLIQTNAGVQCDNITVEDMVMQNVNGFGIWSPNSFTFRGKNHRYVRNTITQLAGATSDVLVAAGVVGGEVSHNIVYPDKGLGINIYESDNVQCFGNNVNVSNSGQGINMASSLYSEIFGNTVNLTTAGSIGISAYEESDNGASARDQIGGLIYGNQIRSTGVGFGLQFYDCSYVRAFGNIVDNCQYGLLFAGGQPLSDHCKIENNSFDNEATAAVLASVIPTNTIVRGNTGYNPVGLLSTPFDNTNNLVGPISGNSATLTSAKTYKCSETSVDILFRGGTVSAFTKNGTAVVYDSTQNTILHLEPSDTFTITFSVTPTQQLVFAN